MIRDAEYKAWLNQQQEIKHQEEVIAKLKSFKPGKIHQTCREPGENAG